MKLRKREKLMAILLLGVLALPRLTTVAQQFFWGEIQRLEQQIAEAQDTVLQYQEKLIDAQQAQANVDELLPQSLPPHDTRAFSIYQHWLYGVAKQAGLVGTLVAPEPAHTTSSGLKAIRARVRGRGSLLSLAELLWAVQEETPLQRLLECRLTPDNQVTPTEFEYTLLVEMLASEQSELVQITLPERMPQRGTAEELAKLTRLTGMFQPYQPPKPKPKPKPRKVTPPKPKSKPKPRPKPVPPRPPVKLVGTFIRGDRAEAIFYNVKTKKSMYVTKGKELRFADGFSAEVLSVMQSSVLLKIVRSQQASIVELKLAQSITELK